MKTARAETPVLLFRVSPEMPAPVGLATMNRQSIFHAVGFAVNVLLLSSILVALFGLAWEYSTRWYLSGFSNAVLPFSSSPEQKVRAILSWMQQGPARATDYYSDDDQDRDPVDTLNFKELLTVCGTGTNAFVNLASAGGLEARRLLLLDAAGLSTNHVVAEVYLDGRWIIVDPTFHTILTDHAGQFLTRQELARPEVFNEAAGAIPNYDRDYNYEHTAFIHVAGLPLVGRYLQSSLNSVLPDWQERINWALLLERESSATLLTGVILLVLAVGLRRFLLWYGRRYSFVSVGPWELLKRGGVALFSAPRDANSPHGFAAS